MYKLITDACLLRLLTFIDRDGKITNNFQCKPLTRDTIGEILSQHRCTNRCNHSSNSCGPPECNSHIQRPTTRHPSY